MVFLSTKLTLVKSKAIAARGPTKAILRSLSPGHDPLEVYSAPRESTRSVYAITAKYQENAKKVVECTAEKHHRNDSFKIAAWTAFAIQDTLRASLAPLVRSFKFQVNIVI